MPIGVQVVFDAADPGRLASFWQVALDYAEEPPPKGFDSWEAFAREIDLPEERWGDQASAVDPTGVGPRLYFQRVPEGKTTKNRVHLDINVAPGLRGDEWKVKVEAHVATLVEAGATVAYRLEEDRGNAVVMQDPEGNEFCVH